jgi:hypothetical protein
MKAIMAGYDVGRSILVLDRHGDLLFDSYNGFRLFAKDLSDRQYYRMGWHAAIGQVIVQAKVIGRQSGLEFIPLTMRTIGGDGPDGLLAVLTLVPDQLIPDIQICPVCGFVVLQDGNVLASSHSLSTANQDIAARVQFDGEYGQRSLDVRGVDLSIHWRRSAKYGLIFVYYAAQEVIVDE